MKPWELFENMKELVYVSDVETNELVYLNKEIQKVIGVKKTEDWLGKPCHKVLQHSEAPCAICNNNKLKEGEFCEWWYYNPVWNKNTAIKDTIINDNGRKLRMEIAIDVNRLEWRNNVVHRKDDFLALAHEAIRISMKCETPDESIDVVLEYLGEMFECERTYIFEKTPEGNDSNTYEWVAKGVKPFKDLLADIPGEVCASWYKSFTEDKIIIIDDVEDIRESDPLQYINLKKQDINSLIVVPLFDNGEPIGFYGVDNPVKSTVPQVTEVLQMLAHFIVSIISHRNNRKEIQAEQVRTLTEEFQKKQLEITRMLMDRAKENLDMVNEIIGSGLWVIEFDENGAMERVFWSPAFRKMLGYKDREEFPDKLESWSELIHPKDRDAVLHAFWESISEHQEYNVKYRLMKKNGEYEWFESHGKLAKYPNGKPRLFVGTFINITKEHLAQQALDEAYQAANRANAAKTDFLASMSHDIRTPLNGIIGMTAIAAASIGDAEKMKHCLSEITISSKHLLRLVNEVLDMNKIETGKVDLNYEPFNLSDLIEELISLTRTLLEAKHHNLSVNIHDIRHENVIGDSGRLQQCLMNFMSNAIKYTPPGGNIKMTIREKPTHRSKFACFEFVFEDNGIGISPEFQKNLFQPFTRAEDERVSQESGTGLGLLITRNILRMMNGDIHVESELNKGSKFTADCTLEIQNIEDEEEDVNFSELPVLVVDDEKTACESTCLILSEIGMIADWVLSGRKGVEMVVNRHNAGNDYYAVILDWKMPDMDGIETARAIRHAVGDEIPIIILSSFDWKGIEAEAKDAGVNAFISKPIFRSKIVRLFKRIRSGENLTSLDTEEPVIKESDNKGRRILLVEDNPLNAEITVEILERTGLLVDHEWNGLDAVNRINGSEDGYYDAVLMDIQMPVMNGYEATTALRNSERPYVKNLPILAMSANAFVEDIQKSLKCGMNDHLAKPIDIDHLLKTLATYLAPSKSKQEEPVAEQKFQPPKYPI